MVFLRFDKTNIAMCYDTPKIYTIYIRNLQCFVTKDKFKKRFKIKP